MKAILSVWRLSFVLLASALTLWPAAELQARTEASRGAKSAKATPAKPVASKRPTASRTLVRPVVRLPPPRLSMGHLIGLHDTEDPLALHSSVALVVDQDTDEVLFSKNPQAVLPIASITKLMTAVVVADAKLPMDEMLSVAPVDELDTGKSSRSRLKTGALLSRGEMLHLALMASENRAAFALGRYYPGGINAFVAAMNRKAAELGMRDTRYVEPTGLSSQNRSSAQDLSLLVKAAMGYAEIRELSTMPQAQVLVGKQPLNFRNTNGLVRNPEWEIGLQKTGFISEAGRCVVMQARLAGRKLIMVLLDSAGSYSRIGDAERLRHWLTETRWLPAAVVPAPTS